jgi:hypothetical protein
LFESIGAAKRDRQFESDIVYEDDVGLKFVARPGRRKDEHADMQIMAEAKDANR